MRKVLNRDRGEDLTILLSVQNKRTAMSGQLKLGIDTQETSGERHAGQTLGGSGCQNGKTGDQSSERILGSRAKQKSRPQSG